MTVRNTLLNIINTHQLDNFKISDLRLLSRDYFSDSTEKSFSNKVYKGVWCLKKEGLLSSKKHSSDSKRNTYALTESGKLALSLLLEDENKDKSTLSEQPTQIALTTLNQKQSEYSTELACASAEAQEYQDLLLNYPQLIETLQSKFMAAKEKAITFQGRLAAIENILQDMHQ